MVINLETLVYYYIVFGDMCGIFALLNHESIQNDKNNALLKQCITNAFSSASHRGPDNSTLIFDSVSKACLGFHRLTINGTADYYGSNQPLTKKGIILLCNGEIYNYNTLLAELGLDEHDKKSHTGSDCEIIIDLYIKFGIETTLELLDGVFAFVLMDMRCLTDNTLKPKLYAARDPFGLRPLYWLKHHTETMDYAPPEIMGTCRPFGFASELKQLTPINDYTIQHTNIGEYQTIESFPPGHYVCYTGFIPYNDSKQNNNLQKTDYLNNDNIAWFIQPSTVSLTKYFTFPHFRHHQHVGINEQVETIATYLTNAVEKRLHSTERPIACLLSGGLDSSLICGIARQLLPKEIPLETYSIGMEGSSDEKYVECVSNYINSQHTHVEVSKSDFLKAIPDVIRLIETYDITTIRASVGNYLIGKYIRNHSNAKVIFNGDGSDELFGGYKYFLNCPDKYEFNRERKRLLTDIHHFDVLRSERCISVNGLEARTPFLDKELVSYVMTLTQDLTFTERNPTSNELLDTNQPTCVFDAMKQSGIEKWMLRRAFINRDIIPRSIVLRSKEAFSDGVSSENDSWYLIIQKYLITTLATGIVKNKYGFLHIPYTSLFGSYKKPLSNNSHSVEDTVSVMSLYNTGLYDKIMLCHRFLTQTLLETENYTQQQANDVMLLVEQWYYKTVYNYWYGTIEIIPYPWMPKYSKETNDPSARTLNVYKKDIATDDEYTLYKSLMLVHQSPSISIDFDLKNVYC